MKHCLVLSFCGLILFAQARVTAEPPVPYLASDGSIPAEAQGKRVFLDQTTGDAYLLFRSDDRKFIPVELSNHIDPAIRVQMSLDSPSQKWRYIYTFKNGSGARQPAALWYFKDLTPEICSVLIPQSWNFAFPQLLTNPPWPRLAIGTSRESGVAPGAEISGFVVMSQLAPGLQEVYAQGLEEHILEMPGEPDDELYEQLKKVIGFPYNYRRVRTLGPRLNLTRASFAAVYDLELRQCESEGLCLHNFVLAAQEFVNQVSQPGRTKTPDSHMLDSAGAGPVERDLAQALVVAALATT